VETIAITAVVNRQDTFCGPDVSDRQRDLRQHHGYVRGVEGGHATHAAEGHRPDDPEASSNLHPAPEKFFKEKGALK